MSKVGLQISAIDLGINASTVKAIRRATLSTLHTVPYIPRIRILGDGHQGSIFEFELSGLELNCFDQK